MTQDNLEIARRSYELLSERDVESWLAYLAEDVELHEAPDFPDSATYRGHDGVRKWATGVVELVEDWRLAPQEVLYESGDALLIRARVEIVGRDGISLEQAIFHLLRFRDGKVATIHAFLEEGAAFAAAGLSE
jgi:ketosteroid isomerase-like protein